MKLTDHVYIGIGSAGSSKGSTFEDWEMAAKSRPRFGRNWWVWIPSIRTNGGCFRPQQITDFNVHWLCFYAYLIVYRFDKKEQV